MSWLRLAAPWAIGLGIVALLVARVDARTTLAALESADLARYLPAALVFVVVWLGFDSFLLSRLFSHLGPPLSWWRTARIRASTYPAMALSFHLASAQLAAALAREQGTRLARSAGGMLVHYLTDGAALAGVALAGTWSSGSASMSYLRAPLAAIAGICGALLVAGRLGRTLLRDRSVIDALAALPVHALLGLVLGRAVFYLASALFVWWTGPAFQLTAPLGALLGRMPVVLAAASLPISPAGLGTTHATMLWLFDGFGSPAQILAFGLVYSLSLTFLRLPLGACAWWLLRSERLHAKLPA